MVKSDAISRSGLRRTLEARNMTELYPEWRMLSLGTREKIGRLAETFRKAIDCAPVLDVAPVVRCKDCRSSRMLSIKEMITFEPNCLVCLYPHGAGVSYPEYDMTERVVTPNDYCSYGRRRENGR